ncbi:hypothetical protein NPIL_46761 [Nephila pilipes]|uniref:Uncharacterized protein n=1 Tax=Nephila pilipes TaxID=299642 RepID=A0A8X6PL40_NEPPI|nr:hypothetical protein NPIL_46761 [Nephila pilipes]
MWKALKEDVQHVVTEMGSKDFFSITRISLQKATIRLDDYEEENIRGLLAIAKERRVEAKEKKWKERLEAEKRRDEMY